MLIVFRYIYIYIYIYICFLSLVIQNDVNSRPMQVSVNINNTITFNLASQILPSNSHNPNTNNVNTHMDENNIDQEDDENENDDNASESDEGSDTVTNDADFVTPTTSDGSENDDID